MVKRLATARTDIVDFPATIQSSLTDSKVLFTRILSSFPILSAIGAIYTSLSVEKKKNDLKKMMAQFPKVFDG